MPFKEEMSWDPSKKRWHRMHKGVMYRVTAGSLGQPPTREATRAAANEWWLRKQAEVDGPPPKTLAEEVQEAMSRPSPLAREGLDTLISLLPGQKAAKAVDRSVKATAARFLEVAKGDMKPLSYRELRQYVHSLHSPSGPLSPGTDVEVIDEDQVERLYLALRNGTLSSGTKKKRWGFFRRYVRYLWEKRLIDLPRNLDSQSFEVKAKRIKTFTAAEVKSCLGSLKPRLRLYALLGLNAGMTSADIGQLEKSMIDLAKGTLTRRRVKTGHLESVPTVTYKLWGGTLDLLKRCWSDDPILALTSTDGTPLWRSTFSGDKTPQVDLVYQQFKRAKAPITLKNFRSIAATALETHPVYGRYVSHFLGHSPKSIADKHYAAPGQGLFDEAVTWLGGQVVTALE